MVCMYLVLVPLSLIGIFLCNVEVAIALLGPSSMYRSWSVFLMGEKWVTSSKIWVMSPTLWEGTSMWGAGLLGFPTF